MVSDAQNSNNIGRLLNYNTQNTISTQFPVDAAIDWANPSMMFVATKLRDAALGTLGWKVNTPIEIGIEAINVFTGNTEERRANQEINNIVGYITANNDDAGLYGRFAFRTVVINSGTTNQQLMAWPTEQTEHVINGINHVLEHRRPDIDLSSLGFPEGQVELTIWDAIANLDRIDKLYTQVFYNNDRASVFDHTGSSATPTNPLGSLTPSHQSSGTPPLQPSHGDNYISPD